MTQILISILRTASKRIVITARNDTAQSNIRNLDQSAPETVAKPWPGHQNPESMRTDTQNQEQNQSDQPPAQTPQRHQSP